MIELEMCKRLKEAGFRQDTDIFYCQQTSTDIWISAFEDERCNWFACACPTADEIWGELTAKQVSKLIYRWFNEEEPGDSIETALAEYWLEVNG